MFNISIEDFFKKNVIVEETMCLKALGRIYNIDVKIEDEDQTFHLLCALPKSLENLKDALLMARKAPSLCIKFNRL